ncbi:MAG: NUDIX domain-containing protein [Chloroflexota bacterium]|nr:NUDIX domain-containing protein [Chloroflexota bacterium]
MTDKDQELVLGVPRARIIGERPWKGILSGDVDGYLDLIASEGEYRPRGEAEKDPDWKQIIPYLLMRDGERLFLMQRTRAGGDARLHDLYSLGIGGHLNPEDGGVLEGLRREFHEEMVADWEPQPQLIGLLNDDDVLVGQVHVGVVFEADAAGRSLAIRETDTLSGRFVDADEVSTVYERMETWSQFLYDHATGRQVGPVERA